MAVKAVGPVLLITGGNTGLGYEIIKALCQSDRAYSLVLAARSFEKARDAIKKVQTEVSNTKSELWPLRVDIADDDSIKEAYRQFSEHFDHLDILVNNAGASFDSQVDPNDASSIRKAWNNDWDVNVTSTHIMTYTFIPLLMKSSGGRIMFITSGASSLGQTTDMESAFALSRNVAPSAGWPKEKPFATSAYRSSKAGLNMLMREWEKALRLDNIKVLCISPGQLATNLLGTGPEALKQAGAADPSVGGNFAKDVIEGREITRPDWFQDILAARTYSLGKHILEEDAEFGQGK